MYCHGFRRSSSWNGDYRICSTHRKLGNFNEQSFKEIYDGPKMRETRSRMLWQPKTLVRGTVTKRHMKLLSLRTTARKTC